MNLRVSLCRVFCFVLCALGFPWTASTAEYTITDLGTLGGHVSRGYDLNNHGEVTGYALDGDGFYRAFRYDGTMHDLGVLAGHNSYGYAISNSGVVAGESENRFGFGSHAAFYNDGSMHKVGTLGSTYSVAYDINDSGLVTGVSYDADSKLRSFLFDGTIHDLGINGMYSSGINNSAELTGYYFPSGPDSQAFFYDGTIHLLGTLGAGAYSRGTDINDSGQIVGYSDTIGLPGFSIERPFLYDGTLHDLGTLGGAGGHATGLNNLGHVVGDALTAGDAAWHPFVYDDVHGMRDLTLLIDPLSGWSLTEALAINDLGQITGYGMFDGEEHAYLLSPVPEPSSLALASAALATVLIGVVIRSKQQSAHPPRI